VGRYLYCARSWWLRRALGHQPTNLAALARGEERHAQHGRSVAAGGQKVALARWLVLIALALGAMLLISLAWK
jgi:hypothetical protein